jgi:hypothetical protein
LTSIDDGRAFAAQVFAAFLAAPVTPENLSTLIGVLPRDSLDFILTSRFNRHQLLHVNQVRSALRQADLEATRLEIDSSNRMTADHYAAILHSDQHQNAILLRRETLFELARTRPGQPLLDLADSTGIVEADPGFFGSLVIRHPVIAPVLRFVRASAPLALTAIQLSLAHGPRSAGLQLALTPFVGNSVASQIARFVFPSTATHSAVVAGYGYSSDVTGLRIQTPFGTVYRPHSSQASQVAQFLSERFSHVISAQTVELRDQTSEIVDASASTIKEQLVSSASRQMDELQRLATSDAENSQYLLSALGKIKSAAASISDLETSARFTKDLLAHLRDRPEPPTIDDIRRLTPTLDPNTVDHIVGELSTLVPGLKTATRVKHAIPLVRKLASHPDTHAFVARNTPAAVTKAISSVPDLVNHLPSLSGLLRKLK